MSNGVYKYLLSGVWTFRNEIFQESSILSVVLLSSSARSMPRLTLSAYDPSGKLVVPTPPPAATLSTSMASSSYRSQNSPRPPRHRNITRNDANHTVSQSLNIEIGSVALILRVT